MSPKLKNSLFKIIFLVNILNSELLFDNFDFEKYWQSHNSKQYAENFSHHSLFVKKLLIKKVDNKKMYLTP